MRATFLQWVRTTNDTRDTASDVASGEIACLNAVAVARELDRKGERSEYAKAFPARPKGSRLAVGHGVTIRYASGKLRTVRAF